jgi:ribonuclease HI
MTSRDNTHTYIHGFHFSFLIFFSYKVGITSWGTFGAGAAAVLIAPSKVRTCYAVKLDFSCTNNIAEYEALLLGLRKLRAMGIRRVVLKTDSQVISGHVDKSCKARDPKLEKYLDTV